MSAPLYYAPQVFAVPDEKTAREVILTPEGATTEERWAKETPHIIDLINNNCGVPYETPILDFGVGIGRISKTLIEEWNGCQIEGYDTSKYMALLAPKYVNHDHFSAHWQKATLTHKFELVLAIWSLQHVLDLPTELDWIASKLAPGGQLFVVNNIYRALPVVRAGEAEVFWVDDGLDVAGELAARFTQVAGGKLSPEYVPAALSEGTFWAVYEHK